jgi:hypothetical protein
MKTSVCQQYEHIENESDPDVSGAFKYLELRSFERKHRCKLRTVRPYPLLDAPLDTTNMSQMLAVGYHEDYESTLAINGLRTTFLLTVRSAVCLLEWHATKILQGDGSSKIMCHTWCVWFLTLLQVPCTDDEG